MTKTISFNIIVEKKSEHVFTAYCLELDLFATSVDCEDVQSKMKKMVGRLVDFAAKNNRLADIFRPARPDMWQKFLFDTKTFIEHNERPVHADGTQLCVSQTCYAA